MNETQQLQTGPIRLGGQAPSRPPFLAISAAGRELIRQVELVGRSLKVALIEGEPGVGKQALARLLHNQSSLARSVFHRCDAREWLLTGVEPQELRGFLYLDRVDLLAAPGQALLLRVLKALCDRADGSFGLVASSEVSLRHMASEGSFHPDLAFRLTAVRFGIPPLRERREDIPLLATSFLDSISARYRLPRLILAPGAIVRLLEHDWPGNARELQSVLESATLGCSNGIIRAQDLCLVAGPLPARSPSSRAPGVLTLETVVQQHIRLVLDLNQGNKLKSARQLGISRSTLYRFLADHSTSLSA